MAARELARFRQLEAEFHEAAKIYERGELDEAGRRLERLAADDAEWSAPRQLLAEIRYRAGRFDDARLHLDWLAEHGVEHPRLALIAGALALARRDLLVAFEALEYAAYVEPDLPSVHTLFGTVLLRRGDWDAAEESFTKAIERNPADANAYDGLATIGLRCGDFEEAAGFSLEALEHDMQFFRAHYHLGVALSHLNRPQEAIAALEAAAKVQASSGAPYYRLSQIAEKQLGDVQGSAAYRDRGRAVIRGRRHRSHGGEQADVGEQ